MVRLVLYFKFMMLTLKYFNPNYLDSQINCSWFDCVHAEFRIFTARIHGICTCPLPKSISKLPSPLGLRLPTLFVHWIIYHVLHAHVENYDTSPFQPGCYSCLLNLRKSNLTYQVSTANLLLLIIHPSIHGAISSVLKLRTAASWALWGLVAADRWQESGDWPLAMKGLGRHCWNDG